MGAALSRRPTAPMSGGLTTATTGSSTQPLSFTGEPRDATGLTYLRTRYYNPDSSGGS